jgi:hypothetical protein
MGMDWGSIIGGAAGGIAGGIAGYRDWQSQNDAINRTTQMSQQQQELMQGYYNTNTGKMDQANSDLKNQATQGGANLQAQASQLSNWQNNQAITAYQGALDGIYKAGRTQAAGSGLIGGFQEGQSTAPAIAQLGQNFASQQVENSRQNMMAQLGVGQQVYSQTNQAYGQAAQGYSFLAGQALQGIYGTGQDRTKAAGMYSDPTVSALKGWGMGSMAGMQAGSGSGGGGGSYSYGGNANG